MASTPGVSQLVWIMLALVLAPPIEELLFRGVLYGGYRKSFGASTAAVLTTGIFVVLHLTETIHFPPATISVTGLAVAALWFRLRTAAIGPAVTVHFGYNLVAVIALLCSTWGK
jgi:membrane protease YdiL (CAAX protease family)